MRTLLLFLFLVTVNGLYAQSDSLETTGFNLANDLLHAPGESVR